MQTRMRAEVLEIPDSVERLLHNGTIDIIAGGKALADLGPAFLVSVARGSSDHVATYLKYASELLLGIPMASVGPSVASIYHAPLHLNSAAVIVVSQSGQSPDIVEMARAGKTAGALSFALTNDPASPLAQTCTYTLNIHAGPERSVAATKTFVNSAVAGLLLLAEWKGDSALRNAIHALPEALSRAAEIDWPELRNAVAGHDSLYTLGRGPGFAISNEAALKFKETCQIHAESYSSAEVLHGPVSIVGKGFPTLALAAKDAAEAALVEVADQIATKGATVFVTSDKAKNARKLPCVRTGHPLTDPLALIVSFYAMVERVARARGINPDTPRHLKKVTETL